MNSKWIALVLVVVAIRSPAQQSDVARKLFEATKAKAESGDMVAQYTLGVSYGKGDGVAKDQVEAVQWFRKA